ncbi:MAG: class I SAM-dependent methyltransferase [Candidatus Taylorbacteria bacterium]|nr:class I SAM-dependent methyltransferase [Candidatus Taylorbacteria bacterium]
MRKNKDLAAFYNSVYRRGEKKHYTKLLFGEKARLPIDEAEVRKAVKWQGKSVLDVGCGTGLMAALAARSGAKKVVGIDFSRDGIRQARRTYAAPNLEYRTEDVKNHRGRYDIVMSLGTLEHMDKPLAALKLFKKHLNPGGSIIITSPNWTNPRGYILQTLRFLFDAPITLADLHYLTPIEFAGWAKALNLKLVWKTFDFEWAQGTKLIKDFSHRLPNVLSDMGLRRKEKAIKNFMLWIKSHVLTLRHDSKWSGATGLYIFGMNPVRGRGHGLRRS